MGNNAMISLLKRASVLVVALLSLSLAAMSLPAMAQETELAPEHLDLARKYVALTDKSGIYEVALVETAVETMRTIITQNPELSEPVDKAITTTLETYRGRKNELLMDQFARVYALNFTMEELQQIVAFFFVPALAFIALSAAALFAVRRRGGGAPVYLAPGYPFTPALFVLLVSAIVLMVGISRPLQALVGVLLVVAGVAAYELPGMRAARAASSEESA